MKKVKNILDFIIKWALVILMAGMTIHVLWQVFTRFVLQNPSSFTEELARYSLVWTGILSAAYVAGQKMHLAIDLLPLKLTGKKHIYLELFIQTCILAFSVSVMLIGGLRLVNITLTLNQISAALQIQVGYVYMVLPISGLIIAFYSVYFIYEHLLSLRVETKKQITNN